MRKDVQPEPTDQWVVVKSGQSGELKPELIHVWHWFIHVIDEVQREHGLTRFDVPVQERRRGS